MYKTTQSHFLTHRMDHELDRLRRENAELKQQLAAPKPELSQEEYIRYGRQMIVSHFGALDGQLRLKQANVLVVGAGGLGCPALAYLAGAGIGHIGIIDGDIVDVSNLHRQVLHTTPNILKCDSAANYLRKLNPNVKVTTYPMRLDPTNAFDIFAQYDLVLDCTDTPATRYLINDVAVLSKMTVVSGSGLKTEGQLTVLNFANHGPCYRCFHPVPPPPDSVTSCSDGGVIGPVIGLLGVSMAIETIKVLTFYTKDNFAPFLAQFLAYPQQLMRSFKMRPRRADCKVCSATATITKDSIVSGAIDYIAYCGVSTVDPLPDSMRKQPQDFHRSKNTVLIDVRPKEQYDITKLLDSLNIPWDQFRKRDAFNEIPDKDTEVVVVCRYGNDSQRAVHKLDEMGYTNVCDIVGGLRLWSQQVDPTIPEY